MDAIKNKGPEKTLFLEVKKPEIYEDKAKIRGRPILENRSNEIPTPIFAHSPRATNQKKETIPPIPTRKPRGKARTEIIAIIP